MSKQKKRKHAAPAAAGGGQKRREWLIPALLVVANLAVFSAVATHEFVALDDDAYVTGNTTVQAGLTWAGLKWAFATFTQANWHPLTWLSHMMDCELYGLNAGRHLLTSLALHTLSSIFLFLALSDMTGHRRRSAVVAALFAIHPLHVESVAWVAERKDVLSGFFCMLTLWLYSRYVREPGSRKKYFAVMGAFAAGLLAKPMLVTLPFLLLLLDYWPLNRWNAAAVREKIPLFVMSAGSSVITFLAQAAGGAVQPLDRIPLDARLSNAVLSYALYLRHAIWPLDLAVFYPLHAISHVWALALALVLAVVTIAMIHARRDHPWLLAGWLWYGGSLVPVIGIIQVGEQAMADRYTYLPLVGIFIAVVWEIGQIADRNAAWRRAAAACAVAALFTFAWAAPRQVGVWENSTTLFEHALAVTSDNHVIENNLGIVLFKEGKVGDALARFSNAARIRPSYADAHMNLGLALASRGNLPGAMVEYDEALRLHPNDATIYFDRGVSFLQAQKLQEALEDFNKAILLNPDYASAHTNAGVVLIRLHRAAEAVPQFREAVRLEPRNAEAHNNLGQALAGYGQYREAEQQFVAAVNLKPDFEPAQRNLTAIRRLLQSPKQ